MVFTTMSEVKKNYKNKKSDFHKGYFDGFNNPNRSKKEVNDVLISGRYENLSEKAKNFVDGKSQGIEDRTLADEIESEGSVS